MSPLAVGIIGFVVLFILLGMRLPVGYGMALIGLTGFVYLVSIEGALSMVARISWLQFSSYSFSVVPLFLLMGQLAFYSGISKRLYGTAQDWLGHLRGGLAMATIGACAGFAAVCGSSVAAAATMGEVALPEMKKREYDSTLATGCVAAGGTLGILIPPSGIMIIYGIMTEQSIGKLFAAGILPGILQAIVFICVIAVACRLNPRLGPSGPKTPLGKRMTGLWGGSIETLLVFVLVLGGLFVGFFTPTEAGGVGAVGVLTIGLLGRRLSWKGFVEAVYSTTGTTAMILIVVTGAMIFNRFLAVTRIPFELANFVAGLQLPPLAIMIIIIIAYIVGGCFIDALGLILLTVPIFFPVAMSLGYDPIWFGVIITVVTEIGLITPPVGMNVFVLKGVAKEVPLFTIFRGIMPFLAGDIVFVAILLAFPRLSLLLPSMMT
jgi:C4-dicarboxylate transporter, DctM subunit